MIFKMSHSKDDNRDGSLLYGKMNGSVNVDPELSGYHENVDSSESSIDLKEYDEGPLTETCSDLSTIDDGNRNSPTHKFTNSDSDCDDYDTDDSLQDFTVKDWLKVAKVMVSKCETPQNKNVLLGKYDELQDFFYFFAIDYFTGKQNVTDLVGNKRREFVMMWQDVIGSSGSIFDLLVDLMNDINVNNSFKM